MNEPPGRLNGPSVIDGFEFISPWRGLCESDCSSGFEAFSALEPCAHLLPLFLRAKSRRIRLKRRRKMWKTPSIEP